MTQILKTKKFYIIVGIILIVGGAVYGQIKKNNQPPAYETVRVQKGDLTQTVEATGKVESQSDLSLRFEVPGIVNQVNVKPGAVVKAGQLLASLRLSELNAAVAQAQANLNQKLAGSTQAEKDYYKATLEQAETELQNNTAVASSYEDAKVGLQTSLVKLDDGLVQADNILGIDNSTVNDDFQMVLSASNPNALNTANAQYGIVRQLISESKNKVSSLSDASIEADIDATLSFVISAYNQMNQLLAMVGVVLDASVTGLNFTQTSLAAKKTAIDTIRTSVNAQLVSLTNMKQAIGDAKLAVKVKEAAYKQALANYNNKTNPVRDVDVASYRAALAQAVAARNKAIIRAPISGVVTSVNKKAGEFIGSSEAVIRMFVPHYEVKVDIPETDIVKLTMDDIVEITLDAFGEETKFSGKVVNIEPGSTDISDVVYYKVTITIGDTKQDVKPGMTANVTISTDSRAGVLFVPLRAVHTNDDGKYVHVLENGQSVDKMIRLGLKGDNGRVEIREGLQEGEEVILGTVSSK